MIRTSVVRQLSLIAIMGAAMVTAWQAGAYAWTAMLAQANPRQALVRDPDNGTALVARVTQDIEGDPDFVPGRADARTAVASLAIRPLNEGTLRIIGSAREAAGDKAGAARAMRLADRVSRRDVLNQLWLIENDVERNDISGALVHYNNALSIRSELGAMLYPVLSSAIVHPEVRAALLPYVRKQARWMPSFLSAAANVADTSALVALMRPVATHLTGEPYQSANAQVIHRLLAAGDTSVAFDLAGRLLPDIERTVLANIAITDASRDPRLGLLGWSFPQNDGISSSVESDGVLSASVSSLSRGTIAERDVIVTPGQSYRLIQRVHQEESGAKAEIRWTAACVRAAGVEPLWNEKLPNLADATINGSTIAVPHDCHLLRLSMAARGPEGQVGSTITISHLSLSKL